MSAGALLREARPTSEARPTLEDLVRTHATLADAGITLTNLESSRTVVVASSAGLLEERDAVAARKGIVSAGLHARPVFTYLANTLRIGDREVPYSLVSALDLQAFVPALAVTPDSIVLNEWAAADMRARIGDTLSMEYYVWEEPGRLVTRSATLTVAGIVPISAGGRDLSPTFPGISDSPTLDDWDPPFPVDLRRVRRVDERVLGAVPDDTEGVHLHRYRSASLAFALWRAHVLARDSARNRAVDDCGRSARQSAAAINRSDRCGTHHSECARRQHRRVARCHGLW